jgi:hypothetical protein
MQALTSSLAAPRLVGATAADDGPAPGHGAGAFLKAGRCQDEDPLELADPACGTLRAAGCVVRSRI